MKYAMCPKCGRRLCKGENGTKVEMECPKCGEFASVIIEEDDIQKADIYDNAGQAVKATRLNKKEN